MVEGSRGREAKQGGGLCEVVEDVNFVRGRGQGNTHWRIR